MAVTNLTNTTWALNEYISSMPDGSLFNDDNGHSQTINIDFTSNNSNYVGIYMMDRDLGPYFRYLVGTGFDEAGIGAGPSGIQIYSLYRTIKITGGTDVTNADLIAWLEANAEQQGGSPTGKTQIGTRAITKKMFGTREITKEVINGVVVYEKQAPMPAKSDIINIDMTGSGTPQQFRVLKINGTIAEVLSMSDVSSQQFASSGQTYENGVLDTYLNSTWYNTLSATAKAAIVDKTFRQDNWYYGTSGNPDYQGKYSGDTAYQVSLGNASYGNEITRHCYAISVQDVLDYLDVTPQMTQADTTLTYDNVWTMFWNSTTTHNGYPWLRSAYASDADAAFIVTGNVGNLDYNYTDGSRAVRPAFTIDLSKIEWN